MRPALHYAFTRWQFTAVFQNRGAEMLRITDKSFQYTPSFSTDLRKRFKKMIRDQQKAAAEVANKPVENRPASSIVAIARRTVSNS